MRKHNYVVGYEGEGDCVFGMYVNSGYDSIELLSLSEAKRKAKSIYYTNEKGKRYTAVVYKLVRVK